MLFYCLCFYVNIIAFVAHCKLIVLGRVQMLYRLQMLLWKVHKMNYPIIAWHFHVNIVIFYIYGVSNWMVLFGKFFIVSPFESYIVHYKFSVDACIWTKIQWLLFMKTCWKQLVKYLCIIIIIVYVCCWYPNDCKFCTYHICIAVPKCWLLNHTFGLRRMFLLFLDNWNSSC
jgi:hypothetical protein